ncbi:hypothetical protein ACP70R_040507 [Stipagrostis hirtigluma subsp. patula]
MEMGGRSGKTRREGTRAAASLPEDVIAEILARVPYGTLCRAKCVSRQWLALCSDPGILRRCRRTLAGFFFPVTPLFPNGRSIRRFVNASGRGPPMLDPSLPFLPSGDRGADASIVDSCNGLLLCVRRSESSQPTRYFVCNPATKKWIDLPDTEATRDGATVRLGFDPAMSSHFRVFVLVEVKNSVAGMEIYASETGGWTYRQSEWGDGTSTRRDSAFFNGVLHLLTTLGSSSVVTVDMDGKTWRTIPTPRDFDFIGQSQGQLYAVHIDDAVPDANQLSIWVLEDFGEQQWILKHTVSTRELFGIRPRSFGTYYSFMVHAIHPERSLIFLTAGTLRSLMSYDMDNKKVRFIWTLGESSKGSVYPYIPFASDWLQDGQ